MIWLAKGRVFAVGKLDSGGLGECPHTLPLKEVPNIYTELT
jgi:hypothetical protein